MPIRISATQSHIIKERWNRDGPSRGWGPAAGPWTSCYPPILTLGEGAGVLNQGCAMRDACPLRADLASAGPGVSDDGCLPNLIAFCESIRTTEEHDVVAHEYNAKQNYTFRFEWEDGSRVFDWTEQVSKETPIPFNISVSLTGLQRTGAGWTYNISRGQQE